ncbi:MAG: hypothetical protein QXK08_00780 [Candidatus Woesearchaeota archaeon]
MSEVTSRRTLVDRVLACLYEIKKLLLERRSADPETILAYIQTIESFTVAGLRNNPHELIRISEMLDNLGTQTQDVAVLDRIKYLRELIKITLSEFKYRAG